MPETTPDGLSFIIHELRAKLPDLKQMLDDGCRVEVLHGTVTMLQGLIDMYDRGMIVAASPEDIRER